MCTSLGCYWLAEAGKKQRFDCKKKVRTHAACLLSCSSLFVPRCQPSLCTCHATLRCHKLASGSAHMSSRWQGRVAAQLRAGTRRMAAKAGKNGGEGETEKTAGGWVKVWVWQLRRCRRLPAFCCRSRSSFTICKGELTACFLSYQLFRCELWPAGLCGVQAAPAAGSGAGRGGPQCRLLSGCRLVLPQAGWGTRPDAVHDLLAVQLLGSLGFHRQQ